MLNAASAKNESPFTATQRQELEHQALIFKYIVAGVPVPNELLYSIKRSLESSVGTSGLFPHHHHQPVGWDCIQVGFGRKADPEPGRCRRTDGKKWRCSKEAYPDSKYCEKHMHRARNRSRKPVEHAAAAATATNASPSINIDPNSTNSPSSSTCILSPYSHQNPGHKTNLNRFFYPHTSSSRSPGCAVTPRNCTTSNHFPDSGSPLHPDNDYRYNHGKASGSVRGLQHPYQELTMSSYKDYSELGFESFSGTTEHQQQQQQEQQQQSCFVLGTDFKSSEAATRPFKLEKEAEIQKSLHHFFDN